MSSMALQVAPQMSPIPLHSHADQSPHAVFTSAALFGGAPGPQACDARPRTAATSAVRTTSVAALVTFMFRFLSRSASPRSRPPTNTGLRVIYPEQRCQVSGSEVGFGKFPGASLHDAL